MEPARFRAYLVTELGEKAVELETAPPDGRLLNGANQHTGPRVDSAHHERNPQSQAKTGRLRAILRAPEEVQALYRAGLVGQAEAAMLGPRQPDAAAGVGAREGDADGYEREGKDGGYRVRTGYWAGLFSMT